MRVGGQAGIGREGATRQDGHDPDDHDRDRGDEDDRRRADEVGDRADDDDRQEAGDRHEHPEDAEHPPTDVLGQVFLEPGLGRDGDEPVGDPGEERDDDDDREQRRHPRQVEPARLVRTLEQAADRAGRGQGRQQDAEGDQGDLDDPPPVEVATVRVEQQDPGHDPEPERQDHDREVLRLEPERLLREGGPQDAQHPDERRRQGEIDERPGDGPMAADEA